MKKENNAEGRNALNNLGRGSENNKKDKDGIFTRETAGLVLILFAAIALVILISRNVIFGNVGFAISSFLLGAFGYCSYAVLAALIYAGVVLLTGKKLAVPRRRAVFCVLLFVFLVCLVHTITAAVGGIVYGSYGEYLSACYKAGENSFFQTTGGGVIIGLIVYPVVKLTTAVGGYIIFSLLILGTAYLIYATETASKAAKRHAEVPPQADYATSDTSALYSLNYADPMQQKPETENVQPSQMYAQPQQTVAQPSQMYAQPSENSAARSKRLYAIGDEFDMKTKREMRQETRRAEEERRASKNQPQSAPVSPYAQSHSILYPDRKGSGDYSWYNERFGSGGGSYSPSRSSKAAEPAPFGSYTSNGIFDKDSYFNNPNRGAISREQYSNNFRAPGSSNFSEGHELSTPRTPAPKPQEENLKQTEQTVKEEKPAQTYSDLYADGTENNISYSERPKKIVTDTTSQTEQTRKPEDFYRNDVPTDFSSRGEKPAHHSVSSDSQDQVRNSYSAGVPQSPQPQTYRPAFEEHESRDTLVSGKQADAGRTEKQDIDVSETMRRVGFGSLPGRRGADEMSTNKGQEASGSDLQDTGRMTRGESAEIRGQVPSRETQTPEMNSDGDVSGRMRNTEMPRRSEESRRADRLSDTTEQEESGLKPITEDFDSAVNLFDDDTPEESVVPNAMDQVQSRREPENAGLPRGRERISRAEEPAKDEPRPKHVYAKYKAPSMDLLRDYPNVANSVNTEEVEQSKDTIVETLAALKIPCEVERVTRGPSVTRYEINIPGNIPTSRVLGCNNELAMRLHAKDGINVQINYESGFISIEVPNENKETVGLKDLLLSSEFMNAKPGSLEFGIGKDIEGRPVCGDIVKMTHLLVAGATNSGKSVCLHALIISLLYKYSPEELRIILVDPKQVEFNIYDKLPHLMINEIINDPAKVVTMLNWAIVEMERRYTLFKEKTRSGVLVREVNEYNASLKPDEEMLPKIVIIIDELADLMSVAKKDVEDRIQRLTQKSRAAGIHLILATQRPSVNVITGVIKSNLPTRIALKVTQEVDSRTILDESGAENLLGQGDLLYRTASMTFPKRVQGAYVTNPEIEAVVDYIKSNNEAYFDDRVADYINNEKGGAGGGDSGDDDSVEAVYIDALRYVVSIGQASISMIQRRCSVGYPKAGKIIEWMENMGYISAFDGAKARKVLLTQEEFDSKYGDYGE